MPSGDIGFGREVDMAGKRGRLSLTAPQRRELRAFMKAAGNSREVTRAQAVHFYGCGRNVPDICEPLMVCERSAWAWLAAYRKDGVEGLREKPHGRKKTLFTAAQQRAIGEAIRQSPRTMGLESNVWTCRLVREWAKKEFGVTSGPECIRRILVRQGYRFGRPKVKLTSPDPEYSAKRGGWRR